MSDTYLPPAVARLPVKMGDFVSTIEMIKDALLDHKDRLQALDGLGQAKAVKPRVRVPAGQTFATKAFGGTYETTDGITFRLVKTGDRP